MNSQQPPADQSAAGHTADQRILNQSLFSKLPQSSYLINRRAVRIWWITIYWKPLDDGQIAGASLDVFATEPLPEMHPFWTHPRVDVTPHIAAFTIPSEAIKAIVANIERIEQGEAPQGVVNSGSSGINSLQQ